MNSLTHLYLYNNDLTGEIPSEIGNLNNLTNLLLQNNELEGCIPQNLSTLCGIVANVSGNDCLSQNGDFAAFCSGTTCDNVIPGCPCTSSPDFAALMAFYESTDGDNWTNNDGWWTACDLNDWYGLEANTNNSCLLYTSPSPRD